MGMTKSKIPLINRELSWLDFNERVLQEASDKTVPLIERLKFLGIYSNNLDEFYRVRVATLSRMTLLNKKDIKIGFNPENILEDVYEKIEDLQIKFSKIYKNILKELEKENIFIVNEQQLTEEQGLYVKTYFQDKVRTNLFPLMLKNVHDLSLLKDKAVYLAICMEKNAEDAKKNYALVKVPVSVLSRFLVLPPKNGKQYVIIVDDVIRYCLDDIFSIFDYDKISAYTIKFSRDAELDIDNDVERSFMEKISDSLKQRKKGKPVRFVYDRDIPKSMLTYVLKKLKVNKKSSIVAGDRYHNFKDFMDFPNLSVPTLEYQAIAPLSHHRLSTHKSILSVIKESDCLLHFPYHSFKHIIDLLREASIDPKVTTVKMTLYRLAKNSNVINALINAARNGKQVVVFLELQARFDEEANIYWSKTLIEEGVKVLHGKQGLKVHSKLILIKRKEKNDVVNYANIGTGNFNEQTAKVYSDLSLLTAHPQITAEVDKVFDLLEHDYKVTSFNKLLVSPFNFRNTIMRFINKEITNAQEHKKAQIILKMNSLVDPQIVKRLYEAAMAGVDVKIIARGICVLVPQSNEACKNIEVIGIVDRFLEHTRIYYFYNGGKEKMYISSADIMTRNIDHRIEVTCPVLDKNIQKIIKDLLHLQLNDNTKARCLSSENYNLHKVNTDKLPLKSQMATYAYLKDITQA